MKFVKPHKHKLPKRDKQSHATQVLARRGWLMRLSGANAHWRQNTWNEAHKIKHRSLNYWWCLKNIPF